MVLNLPEVVKKDDTILKIPKPEKEIIDLGSFTEDIPTTIIESNDDL